MDLFASGKLAFYIGTGMDRWKIEDKNPNLDYGISFMPQFENSPYEANLATYYAFGVNKFSDDVYLAQKVVEYLATDQVSYVLVDAYKVAPALRSLISFCTNEYYQNVFCSQVINSYNWSKPVYSSSRQVFKDMIDNVSVRGSSAYDMAKAGQEYITNIKILEND
ncbi:MAG: extracellular solute-binding protein [Candidatus Pacebacteria bacterium]|nr:extracellular solute-binding protein [Candidatus Paceibacterota bacterium]